MKLNEIKEFVREYGPYFGFGVILGFTAINMGWF